MRFKAVIILLLFTGFLLKSQEIPPIQKFSPQQTGSGNQNWMITQGENGNIYFANNKGLLEFNGSKWNLYPSPNGTIFRSVKKVKKRIYTGTYMDFGYWLPKENGSLYYQSLVEQLNIDILEDEQFWNILEFNELVVFQSLDRLIIVDVNSNSFKTIEPKGTLLKSFKSNNQLYIFEEINGLSVVEKGEIKPINSRSTFKGQIVLGVFNIGSKKIAVTNKSGFYDLTDLKNIKKWEIKAQEELSKFTFYDVKKLASGNLLIGTIANGLFELNKDGEVVQRLNQTRGLLNNTTLSVFEDQQKNTWIGVDNGINCINNAAAFYEYKEHWDELGTVYGSRKINGYEYLATNRGLFSKKETENNYTLIPETSGQVWNLQILKNTLFAGQDKGTFVINKNKARKIGTVGGTWIFKEHPTNENLIFQGNYNGIHVLEKKNNVWKYKNKIEGFDISSRLFEFVDPYTILVGHEYKGVFKLKIDKTYSKIVSQKKERTVEKGVNAGLTSFDKDIYYYYKKGVFKYDFNKNIFIKDHMISSLLDPDEYDTGKMIADDQNRLWFITKNKMHYFTKDVFGKKLIHNSFYLNQKNRKSISGFEHIAPVRQNVYLIGSNEGYVLVDLEKIKNYDSKIKLDAIISKSGVAKSLEKETTIANDENNLTFEYSSNIYQKYYPTSYQYRLLGKQEEWSSWKEYPFVKFENLNFGNYTFQVRSKIGEQVSEIITSPKITILPPWYWSNTANGIYVFSFFLFILMFREYYLRKNRKEQLQIIIKNNRKAELIELENQKELIKIKNEQLQNDVQSKNRELAIATMSTLKRNDFLNKIKKDLTEMGDHPKAEKLIKKINKNLKKNDDWEFFEDAFNNADKDFFKEVKNKHPKLTNNDLKLCAFLRLNLSSKEIAPLLNISVHSVEIKRYRLRKKMNLTRDQRIVDYIMTL